MRASRILDLQILKNLRKKTSDFSQTNNEEVLAALQNVHFYNLDTGIDYLFLVPWLKRGGGDLEIINYINAIKSINKSAKIVVVATLSDDNPWKKRLPSGVQFISIEPQLKTLRAELSVDYLFKLTIYLKPKKIMLVNSAHGYLMFARSAKELAQDSKLYIVMFCFDYTPEGERSHYVLEFLKGFERYISYVFTDNRHVIRELVEDYNFPAQKFKVIYQPFSGKLSDPIQRTQRFSQSKPLKVLWGGRLDAQKRPDIMVKVCQAARREKLPVAFHVYGSSVVSNDEYSTQLRGQDGIVYHGSYDNGLNSLPLEKYHLFLLTSAWEGMPNVLLEATAGRLPVIAADVGGVSEFINNKTGVLIKPHDNISQYVNALRQAVKSYETYEAMNTAAHGLLTTQHSWKKFVQEVKRELD